MDIKKLLVLLSLICVCFRAQADNEVNYIEQHGRLQLVGNQLSNANGDPIQLKGFTAFSPDYDNCLKSKEDLVNLREMGVSCVRIARQISGGNIISDEQVKQWMEWTYEAGLYCIIDWNFMDKYNTKKTNSGDPNDYIDEAAQFFHMVAQEVADKQYKHVLYEICNEPSQVEWATIKSYAEAIIDTITGIDTNKPIIIVGTPNWCQNIYTQVAQSNNKITTDKAGIMYAFHFYAGEISHINLESSEFLIATRTLPIFATEWNLGNVPEFVTSENNTINTNGGKHFMNHCLGLDGSYQIVSWIYNSYGSGGNGASLFKEECGGDLTTAGELIDKSFRGTCCTGQYNYVEEWGRLQLVGNQLSDKNGNSIQLKGFSAFSPDYDNCLKSKEDLEQMRNWGMNCVRITKMLTENGLSDDEVKKWMELTQEAGMYCIIDWHIIDEVNGSGNPNDYIEEASAFFRMVAQEVADKDYKHIIYELCNEPSEVSWVAIKSYEEAIIETITGIDTNKPIIIAGVPNWDQNIYSQVASTNMLIETDKAYVMYAFHFYANETSHISLESNEFLPATNRIPVFVSEWNLGKLPAHSTDNKSINITFGKTFLSHCAGENGSGQIVSWIYNGYGSGGNGAGAFTDECGELSAGGRCVLESIDPTCCAEEYYYVKEWGRLQLVGNQLSDEKGRPIQLKGYNTFSPDFNNCLESASDLERMRTWGMNCVRISRVLTENGLSDDEVKKWMKLTQEAGIYCIIDWHIIDEVNGSGNPNDYIEEASAFFRMVAQEVADKEYKHIIYELCNEPSEVEWTAIKSYEEVIIDIITSIDTNKPIIIAGVPNWDQNIYSQVANTNMLIETDKAYVMYAFHFYANETSHIVLESSEFLPATTRIPVFVSEWNLGKIHALNDDDKTINTTTGNTFLSHCAGENGSGQIVSWIYNAFGSGGNGAGFYKDECWNGVTDAEVLIWAWTYPVPTEISTQLSESTIVYPTIVEEGRFTVSTPNKATVLIYNLTGALLQTEEIDGTSEISTQLAPGIYTVKVIREEETQTTKIIVK